MNLGKELLWSLAGIEFLSSLVGNEFFWSLGGKEFMSSLVGIVLNHLL